MKAYGRKLKDHGCCPGHDKFPSAKYNSRRSTRAHRRMSKVMHRRARALNRVLVLDGGG